MSHGAFFQTNTEMAERLYAVAAEYAGLSGSERVFDLYCGIGTIGLSMASGRGEVWGLEIVPEAIADAERNAERQRDRERPLPGGDARTGVRPLIEEAGKPDVVVIDPPRAGLSQKIVRRVLECEAKRIVYVSCNPTTLAPNAAQMVEAGYRLRRVRPVDMFPQTPHIECVALLENSRTELGATHRWQKPDGRRRAGERGERHPRPLAGRGFGVGAGLDPRSRGAGRALRGARLCLDLVQRPSGGERAGDAGRVRRRRPRRSTSASPLSPSTALRPRRSRPTSSGSASTRAASGSASAPASARSR